MVFDLVCSKFQSLTNYYWAEDPATVLNETNDSEGKYFPEKYRVEVFTLEDEFMAEYFTEFPAVFEWLGKIFGQPVKSEERVNELVARWQKESKYAYYYIDKFKIVDRWIKGNTNF